MGVWMHTLYSGTIWHKTSIYNTDKNKKRNFSYNRGVLELIFRHPVMANHAGVFMWANCVIKQIKQWIKAKKSFATFVSSLTPLGSVPFSINLKSNWEQQTWSDLASDKNSNQFSYPNKIWMEGKKEHAFCPSRYYLYMFNAAKNSKCFFKGQHLHA